MLNAKRQRSPLTLSAVFACVIATGPAVAADETREAELKAPMLLCRELAGGVRPPTKPGAEPEHDLVFFVLAGRNSDGSEILEAAPKGGGHLKIDNRRKSMLIKDVALWKGPIKEGGSATFVVSVREQDGKDSADADLKEAADVARQVDSAKRLTELARIPVHEVLQGDHGENDHIGTIVIRITNTKGNLTLEAEPGSGAHFLKGYASNHPRQRAFKLNGDHSDYELHLSLGD